MNIEQLKNSIGDYAKDIRLNLSLVMTEEGSFGLTQRQIYLIALSCSWALKNKNLIEALKAESELILSDNERLAAQSAAAIMAMNNIYYRFLHLVEDPDFARLPAKLRMNILANPGIDKADFELICLSISTLNGCGMCIKAHAQVLGKGQIAKESVQSAVRIAAVFNAVATVIEWSINS